MLELTKFLAVHHKNAKAVRQPLKRLAHIQNMAV